MSMQLIGADFLEGFVAWAGPTLLAVTLLTGFVLLVRRPVARVFGAKAAYALWSLPLVRLLLPGLTVPRPSWLGSGADAPEALPALGAVADRGAATAPVAAVDAALSLSTIIAAILAIWLVGCAVVLARSVFRQVAFRRALGASLQPLPAQLAPQSATIAKAVGLRRRPDTVLSPLITGPLVTGLLSPLVVLPDDVAGRASTVERAHMFAHEYAHIRRGDLGFAALAQALGAAFWFHPLAGMALRAFRSDQEAACDADVLQTLDPTPGARADYARTLLQAARRASPGQFSTEELNRSAGAAHTPDMGALALTLHHPLKERLMTLSNSPRLSGRRARLATTALLLGAGLCTAPLTFADPQTDDLAKPGITTQTTILKQTVDGETLHIEADRSGDSTVFIRVDELGNRIPISEAEMKELGLGGLVDGVLKARTAAGHLRIDLTDLEGDLDGDTAALKDALSGLQKLEGLKSLESLDSLGGLSVLSGLGRLGALGELGDLDTLERVKRIKVVTDGSLEDALSDGAFSFAFGDGMSGNGSPKQSAIQLLDAAERLLDKSDDPELRDRLQRLRDEAQE